MSSNPNLGTVTGSTGKDPVNALDAKTNKSSWWRAVLGEYPTGVCIISSVDPETKQPIGMIVGTFSAVSEDPPVVGFMPATGSYTAKRIIESGRFCVSVLAAGHEALSRSFAKNHETRFTEGEWTATDGGILRLEDAVSWFEADISNVVPLGDHTLVLGDVRDFGVGNGNAGLPLLFLKGGYGSFSVPTLEFNPQGLGANVRTVNQIRASVEALAETLDVTCYVATVAKDSVMVLASSNEDPEHELVGQAFPFAAPMASVLAAWSTPERLKVWEESARHLLGVIDRPFLAELLERVRLRGYAVSIGEAIEVPFDAIVSNPESKLEDYSRLWSSINDDYRTLTAADVIHKHVHAIQVPVFGPDGNAMLELFVSGLGSDLSQERFAEITRGAVCAASDLSKIIGGVVPDDYPKELHY
ncbi:MAG: flavin reductase [Gulosibacter sp.]|uniref:flavin reductase n=1 Tax=Gulosibacter sp. TaxID=2817531 RepID=UPI003F939F59